MTARFLARPGTVGLLAALILTDQFPRNMFRDDPRAFATDALALRIADRAIAQAQARPITEPPTTTTRPAPIRAAGGAGSTVMAASLVGAITYR